MKQGKLFTIAIALLISAGSSLWFYFIGMQRESVYTEKSKRFKNEILSDSINRTRSYQDGNNANVKDETGTPLFFYAQSLDTAKYLVEHRGVDPERTNANGETVLHHYIKNIIGYNTTEKVPILKYYLRRGLDPYQPDTVSGKTPKELMNNKTCKGKNIFWDKEIVLLVNDPNNQLLAPDNYKYNHAFPSPRMSVKSISGSHYSTYINGNEFQAENKSATNNTLVLSYRGSIINRSISLSIHNDTYDFETCAKQDSDWVCRERDSGIDKTFYAPAVAISSSLNNVKLDGATTYSSFSSSKNLQPSGRIYLSYTAAIPEIFTVYAEYPLHYDLDSVKIFYGRWVGNKI